MRYFVDISYRGENYHGWQIQENAITIQSIVEEALKTFLRKNIKITGSGRTDAGVHALKQTAHFDFEAELDPLETCYRLNKLTPKDISFKNLRLVSPKTHARFDAIYRKYIYQLSTEKLPFHQGLYFQDKRKYDFELMNTTANILLDYEDFECFSKIKTDVKNYRCQIQEAYWQHETPFYRFHIKSNRFLRGMVRMIVGMFLQVGSGKISTKEFEQIIQNRNRDYQAFLAPAEGLFLAEVKYDY